MYVYIIMTNRFYFDDASGIYREDVYLWLIYLLMATIVIDIKFASLEFLLELFSSGTSIAKVIIMKILYKCTQSQIRSEGEL